MKTKLPHIICLLALLVFHSCSHDGFDRGKGKSGLSIDEARAYFENNATDLRYNELVYSYTPTKADDNIVPLWNKAMCGTTLNSEVVMVPILETGKIKAFLTITLFGRKDGTADNVKVESHLVIQRYNTSKKMRRFITTVVGISDDAKANPYLFTGDRTKFQGFMLISDETGKCEDVFYYTGGRRLKMQIGNYTAEEKRNNKYLQVSVGFSFMETSVAVKGGGGHLSGEDGDSYCYNCHSLSNFDSGVCAVCGAEPQEIGGGEGYFFCKGCGELVESCTCEQEPTPDTDPVNPNEEACPLCGNINCCGECQNTGTGGGGHCNDNPNSLSTGGNFRHGKGYKIIVPHSLHSMTPQDKELSICVFCSMEYICSYFGYEKSRYELLYDYSGIYGNKDLNKILFNGVESENFTSFVNHIFNTTSFTGYVNALDAGHPVIEYFVVGKDNNGKDYGHCIVIVGYYPDGKLIYMDPYTGNLREAYEGEIDTKGRLVIVNVKI